MDNNAINPQQSKRLYDAQNSSRDGHYMEVKAGYQTLNSRVKRQIDFDRQAIYDNRVSGVKWEFRPNGKDDPSPQLLQYLTSNRISYTIVR